MGAADATTRRREGEAARNLEEACRKGGRRRFDRRWTEGRGIGLGRDKEEGGGVSGMDEFMIGGRRADKLPGAEDDGSTAPLPEKVGICSLIFTSVDNFLSRIASEDILHRYRNPE